MKKIYSIIAGVTLVVLVIAIILFVSLINTNRSASPATYARVCILDEFSPRCQEGCNNKESSFYIFEFTYDCCDGDKNTKCRIRDNLCPPQVETITKYVCSDGETIVDQVGDCPIETSLTEAEINRGILACQTDELGLSCSNFCLETDFINTTRNCCDADEATSCTKK